MKELLYDKSRQTGVCTFFAMILSMCLVGSYYMQYTNDLYWVKLFTYSLLLLCAVYMLISSALQNRAVEKEIMISVLIILSAALIESIFGIIRRVEWRKAAEDIVLFVKATGVFVTYRIFNHEKNCIKRWIYLLISALLMLVPAIFKSIPLNISALSSGFLADNLIFISVIFYSVVILYGVLSAVPALIRIIKKKETFASWSVLIYDLSIILFGFFKILRLFGKNFEQASKNTAILFEVAIIMLMLSVAEYNKPKPKKSTKRK